MKDRAYALGFIYKCAEYGVSPYEAGVLFTQKEAQMSPGVGTALGWGFAGPVGGMIGGAGASYNQQSHMGGQADNYIRGQMQQNNPNAQAYMDKVDAGKHGTMLGRAWHGMMDNALGRSLGIRGARQYRIDKNVERINKGNAMMQQDIDEQNMYANALNAGPNGNGLQVSQIKGFRDQSNGKPGNGKTQLIGGQAAQQRVAPQNGKAYQNPYMQQPVRRF